MSFEIFAERLDQKLEEFKTKVHSASKRAIRQIAAEIYQERNPLLDQNLESTCEDDHKVIAAFLDFWINEKATSKSLTTADSSNPFHRLDDASKAILDEGYLNYAREHLSNPDYKPNYNLVKDQMGMHFSFMIFQTIAIIKSLSPQENQDLNKRIKGFTGYVLRELQNPDNIADLNTLIKHFCGIVKIIIIKKDDKEFIEQALANFPPKFLDCVNGTNNDLDDIKKDMSAKPENIVTEEAIKKVLKNTIAKLRISPLFIDNELRDHIRVFDGNQIHIMLHLKYLSGLISYDEAQKQDPLFRGVELDDVIMREEIFSYSDNLKKAIIKEARYFLDLVKEALNDKNLKDHEKINKICNLTGKKGHAEDIATFNSEGKLEINYDKLEEFCMVFIQKLSKKLEEKKVIKNSPFDEIEDISNLYTKEARDIIRKQFDSGEDFNFMQCFKRYSTYIFLFTKEEHALAKELIEKLKKSNPKNHQGREILQKEILALQRELVTELNPKKSKKTNLKILAKFNLSTPSNHIKSYHTEEGKLQSFFNFASLNTSVIFRPDFGEIIKHFTKSENYKKEIFHVNINQKLIERWVLILLEKEDLDTFKILLELLVENKLYNPISRNRNKLADIISQEARKHIKLKKGKLDEIEKKYYDFTNAIFQAQIASKINFIKNEISEITGGIMLSEISGDIISPEIRNLIVESCDNLIKYPSTNYYSIATLSSLSTCVDHCGQKAFNLIIPYLEKRKTQDRNLSFNNQHCKNNIIKQALQHKYNSLAKSLIKHHIETRKDDKLLTIIEIIQHLNEDQYQEFNFLYKELAKIVDKDGKKANIIEILAQKYDDAIDFVSVIKFIKSQPDSEKRFNKENIPRDVNCDNFFYLTNSRQNYLFEIFQALYKNDKKDFCQTLYKKIVKNIDSFIELISISNPSNIISEDFYADCFEKFKKEYFEQDIDKIIQLGESTIKQTRNQNSVNYSRTNLSFIFEEKIPINEIIHKALAVKGAELKISPKLRLLLKEHLFNSKQSFENQLKQLINVEPQENKSYITQNIYIILYEAIIQSIRRVRGMRRSTPRSKQEEIHLKNIATLNEILKDINPATHKHLVKTLYGQDKDIDNEILFLELDNTQIREFKELFPQALQYHKRLITQRLIKGISELTSESQHMQSELGLEFYTNFIKNKLIEVNQLTKEQIERIFDFVISPTPEDDFEEENQENKELIALGVTQSQISEIKSKERGSPEHQHCLSMLELTLKKLTGSSEDLLTNPSKAEKLLSLSQDVSLNLFCSIREDLDEPRMFNNKEILIKEILSAIYENSTIDHFVKLIKNIEKGIKNAKDNAEWRNGIAKELLHSKEKICQNIQDSFKNEEISNEQKIKKLEDNLDFIIQTKTSIHDKENTRIIQYFMKIISLISFSKIEKESKKELFKKLEDTVDKIDPKLKEPKNEIKTELARRAIFLETKDFNQIKSAEDAKSAIDEAKNSQELAAATTEFYYSAEKQFSNCTTETRKEISRQLWFKHFKVLDVINCNFEFIKTKEDLRITQEAIEIGHKIEHDYLNIFGSTETTGYSVLTNQLKKLSDAISKVDDTFEILEKAQFYLNGDIKPFVDQIKELRKEFSAEKRYPDHFHEKSILYISYLKSLNNPFKKIHKKIHKKIQEQTTVENSDTLKNMEDEIFKALKEEATKKPTTELSGDDSEKKTSRSKRKAEKEGEEEEDKSKRLKKVTTELKKLTKEADKKQTARGKRKREAEAEAEAKEQEPNKAVKPERPQRPQAPTDPQAHQPLAEFQPPGRFHR